VSNEVYPVFDPLQVNGKPIGIIHRTYGGYIEVIIHNYL